MYEVDLFVIAVYCLICDELYPTFLHRFGPIRHGGFSPQLTDCECLTIEIVGPFLGYDKQKRLFNQMSAQFGAFSPALKERVAFVRQSANLWQVKAFIWQQLVERLQGHHAPLQIIDTLPMPILKLARGHQRKVFRAAPAFEFPEATKGYCAAKDEDYFGFKVGLRITSYGLIVHAPILQAYGHDATCRDELLADTKRDTTVVGDMAFLDWGGNNNAKRKTASWC